MKYMGCIQKSVNYTGEYVFEAPKGPQSHYENRLNITLPCGQVFDAVRDYESFTVHRPESFIYFNYTGRGLYSLSNSNKRTHIPPLYADPKKHDYNGRLVVYRIEYINEYTLQVPDSQWPCIAIGKNGKDYEDCRDYKEAVNKFLEGHLGEVRVYSKYSKNHKVKTDVLIFTYVIDFEEINNEAGFYMHDMGMLFTVREYLPISVNPFSEKGIASREGLEKQNTCMSVEWIDNEECHVEGYMPFKDTLFTITPVKDITRKSGFYVGRSKNGRYEVEYIETAEEFDKRYGFFDKKLFASEFLCTQRDLAERFEKLNTLTIEVENHKYDIEKNKTRQKTLDMTVEAEERKHYFSTKDYERKDRQESMKFGYAVGGLLIAGASTALGLWLKTKK